MGGVYAGEGHELPSLVEAHSGPLVGNAPDRPRAEVGAGEGAAGRQGWPRLQCRRGAWGRTGGPKGIPGHSEPRLSREEGEQTQKHVGHRDKSHRRLRWALSTPLFPRLPWATANSQARLSCLFPKEKPS